MEQCERISLRNVQTIAESLEAASERVRTARQQQPPPFQVWADTHSFSTRANKKSKSKGPGGLITGQNVPMEKDRASGPASQAEDDIASVSAASAPSQV